MVLFKSLEKRGKLGRQPETRKRTKLRGCLRKQGMGRQTYTPTLGLLGTRDVPSPDMPPPPTLLGVSGRHFYMLPPAAAQQETLNPKP